MTLLQALRAFFLQYGVEKTYWIALSGGLDSQVLLSLCQSLRQALPIKLRVLHINHGLSVNASAWAAQCEKNCFEYGIDYISRRVTVSKTRGKSTEEIARNERYAVFAEYLQADDILLTAHHQDDQAETVLLQLMRGAGIKGLAAMPEMKPFAAGWLGRPLLTFTRDELKHYAEEKNLQWVEDESNENNQFTRNFIRQTILPPLKTRFPAVTETLARSAKHCADAQALLEEMAQELCAEIHGSKPNTLSVSQLLKLTPLRQKLILRTFIHTQGYPLPDTKKLTTILQTVLTAAGDRAPSVTWQATEIRRYRDDIYLMSTLKHNPQQTFAWAFDAPLTLPSIGTLKAYQVQERSLAAHIKQVFIRFRQGGEKVHVRGEGRHTLKNLFQEWQVPTWLRDRIPLIFLEEKCIGAVGYFLDEDYVAKREEAGWKIILE